MKAAVDLHIHSALSPCSEKEMTPNNIANMAFLKGLDIIAITDHNSVENFKAVFECTKLRNILAVPGIEVETSEEIHVICLFTNEESAFEMQSKVYSSLPPLKNREDIFGEQLIMDSSDSVVKHLDRLLLTATSMGIDDVFKAAAELGGVALPAHVDRDSYSVLSNLGMIPENLCTKYLELSAKCCTEQFLQKHPSLCRYSFLKSSDAHRLGDILERESFIELDEFSIEAVIAAFK